jgi:transcriptional regulator with XRE-family HTH domain
MGYENKGIEPNYSTLCRIADALGITVDRLLGHAVPSIGIQVNSARRAGLDVREAGGSYVATVTPAAYDQITMLDKKILEGLNLSPLPALEFDRAVKFARQHVLDENNDRFILWILTMIDHENMLKNMGENRHIPLAEQSRMYESPLMQKLMKEKAQAQAQKKELPPSEG